jgi:hypothetical protein
VAVLKYSNLMVITVEVFGLLLYSRSHSFAGLKVGAGLSVKDLSPILKIPFSLLK